MKNQLPNVATMDELFAHRLNELRTAAGMTYETLSQEMLTRGVAIHPSAIQKTEKGGRKVTLQELVTYSHIFATPVGQMLNEDAAIVDGSRKQLAEEIRGLASELSSRIARLGA